MPEITSIPKKPMTYLVIGVIAILAMALWTRFAPVAVKQVIEL